MGVFDVAAAVSTPLGLGGLVCAVLFYIFRQVIAKGLISKLSSSNSASVIKLIVDRLFLLALVAVILGFIGFLVSPRSKPEGSALLPQAPITAKEKLVCRHPSNGVESWGKEQQLNFDSGWRSGGSNPNEFCRSQLQERKSQFPDREITLSGVPQEQSKEEFFRQFYYRYTCVATEKWAPVFISKENIACAQ